MLSIKSSVKSELKLKMYEICFVLSIPHDMMKQNEKKMWKESKRGIEVYADAMTPRECMYGFNF